MRCQGTVMKVKGCATLDGELIIKYQSEDTQTLPLIDSICIKGNFSTITVIGTPDCKNFKAGNFPWIF